MAEEIEDDLTTLQQKNNQSPLVFYGNLGSSYLVSFKKRERNHRLLYSWALHSQSNRLDFFLCSLVGFHLESNHCQ